MFETISTAGLRREEWLRIRKSGIGGSDVGAVCGLNRYRSGMKGIKAGKETSMMTVMEQLYYGRISPCEKIVPEDREYQEANREAGNMLNGLSEKLEQEACDSPYLKEKDV